MTVETGTFAHNCAETCFDDPDTDCSGVVFIAGTDRGGLTHALGTCVTDILENRQGYYDDIGLVLHGTHRLTTEQLDEVFGVGVREMPPEHINLDALTFSEWRPSGDVSRLVAVTINHDNPEPEVITLDVLADMFRRPQWYVSDNLTIYGTHILTEQQIQIFFPGE